MIHVVSIENLYVKAVDDLGGVLPAVEVDKPRKVNALKYNDVSDDTSFMICDHNGIFRWVDFGKVTTCNP